MMNGNIQRELNVLFSDPTLTAENVKYQVENIISELEEELTILKEKIERLEYTLGLTGLEGKKDG